MFFEKDKKILPSCCGLEQWEEVVNNLSHRKGVWLGHDPTPVVEYQEHGIIVWSDDYNESLSSAKLKKDLVSIEFSINDLDRSVVQVRDDIKKFFDIQLRKRLNEIDSSNSNKVVLAAMAGFNVS